MKNKKLLKAMSFVDEKYVTEADPRKKSARRFRSLYLAAAVAAILSISMVIGAGAWLLVPYNTDPPEVSKYADSEYYELIKKLNTVTYQKPRYDNNLDMIFGTLTNMFGAKAEDATNGGAMTESAGMPSLGIGINKDDAVDMDSNNSSDSGGDESYEEITDNQVSGVTEGDRIKRSSKHIYYLNGTYLKIYTIAGEESTEICSFMLSSGTGVSYYNDNREMYLSEDCKTVTVITPCYDRKQKACMEICAIDVSDPQSVRIKKRVTVTGGYLSSRMTDGELLLLSQFSVGRNPDFSDESQFLPQIDNGKGFESVPMKNIISPETLDSARYTVVCKFNEATLDMVDCSAFLSYSEQVYVSKDNIYVTRNYTEKQNFVYYVRNVNVSDVYAMKYKGEKFAFIGGITVEGSIKNQYSMDEYEGLFRVVTTTSEFNSIVRDDDEYGFSNSLSSSVSSVVNGSSGTNANLYCIDFATKKVVAQVTAFAPAGEVIQSARFDGDIAYVCTSVEFKDPVFMFDLSDINNITYKETGTIEGYSSSLVNFGNGYLMGIGYGSSRNDLKIEIYEEGKDTVEPVCKYELCGVTFSENYKSYYIDRENQLVGLGVFDYGANFGYDISWRDRYILLHFDGYALREVLNEDININDMSYVRGVYIDGYFYILDNNGLKVVNLNATNG